MGAGQPKPIKPSNEFVSAPTNINRPTGEINVKEEHNNYPAFISFNGDENYDEARFSIWTIVAAIGATLFLIYIIKRIWDCRRKSVAKKEEKAAKKEEIAPYNTLEVEKDQEDDHQKMHVLNKQKAMKILVKNSKFSVTV